MNRLTLFDGSNYMRRKYAEHLTMSGLRAVVRDLRSEIARPDNRCIFVWDGFRANDYRKSFYPIYKEKREAGPDDFYIQMKILKEIMNHLPILQINVPEYEADDIIGYMAVAHKGYKIHVKSTDKDFEQLEGVTHEGTTLDLPTNLVIPYKVMVGDKSDNIKGIPGFGEKMWIAVDKEQVARWFDNDFAVEFRPTLSNAVTKWCDDNVDQLRVLRRVCEFRPVDDALIAKHMTFGTNNPAEVERILKDNLA